MKLTPHVKQEHHKEKDHLAVSDDDNQIDLLNSLPDELWRKILADCSEEDLQHLAQTNIAFNAFITQDHGFWQQKLNSFTPPSALPIAAHSTYAAFWRTYYLDQKQFTKSLFKQFSLAKNGNQNLLEQIQANDLCNVDRHGLTILDWLRINKHQSILDQLYKQSSLGTSLECSPLCWSIICNQDEEIIRTQLEQSLHSARSKDKDKVIAQALRTAATAGQIDLLKKTILVASDIRPISAHALGMALNESAERGCVDLVNCCYSLAIKPTNSDRKNALARAAKNGHLKVIVQLCQVKNIPSPSTEELFPALIQAINQGYFNIVKYLTENKQFERSTIIEGLTIAISGKRTAIAKYLIDLQKIPHLEKLQMNELLLSLNATAQSGQREIFAHLCASITHPENRKQLSNDLWTAFGCAVDYNQCSIIDYLGRSPVSPLPLSEKFLRHYLSVSIAQKKWPSFVMLYHLAKNYNAEITQDILRQDKHHPNKIPVHMYTELSNNTYYAELCMAAEQLNNPLLSTAKLILNQQLQAYKEQSFINFSRTDKHLQAALLQIICDIDNYKLTTQEELEQCFEKMKNTKELSGSLKQINEMLNKILGSIQPPNYLMNRATQILKSHLKRAAPQGTSFFSKKHKRLNAAVAAIIADIDNYTLTTEEELKQRFNEMQNKFKDSVSLDAITSLRDRIFGRDNKIEENIQNTRDNSENIKELRHVTFSE